MERNAFINNKNIWETWGAELMDGSMEALLTPAPLKDYIQNESRLEHGTRIISTPESCKMAEREISIPVLITGTGKSDYLSKYASFVNELISGKIALKVPALGKVYNLYYLSCGKYGSYGECRGKLMVKLKEPNPADRGEIV